MLLNLISYSTTTVCGRSVDAEQLSELLHKYVEQEEAANVCNAGGAVNSDYSVTTTTTTTTTFDVRGRHSSST